MTESRASVELFLMFFSAAKRTFTLAHAMHTRRAAHKAVFVRARQLVAVLNFLLSAFHSYNITHFYHKVKRQCGTLDRKLFTGRCANMARGAHPVETGSQKERCRAPVKHTNPGPGCGGKVLQCWHALFDVGFRLQAFAPCAGL